MEFSEQVPIEPRPYERPKRDSSGWKIFWGVITGLSIFGNIVLFLMLIGVSVLALSGTGGRGYYVEEVVRSGPATRKIVVIHLTGLIDESVSDDICEQIRRAGSSGEVRGIILSVDSPGGLVSASDQIYNEIKKLRQETTKPVVAFMHNVAASGGYYASVACESIVAEPTAITGSIGVIASYFVFQKLLEGKLGIEPVVIKSGLRKDWPSLFRKPDEEQLQYLREKFIEPSYERFVKIVADSRDSLTESEVRKLADGSIYNADEAKENKLIDKVGYFDEALDEVMYLAGIKSARVVTYRRPFSLSYLLNMKAENTVKIDRSTLHRLSAPQVMYLWSIY